MFGVAVAFGFVISFDYCFSVGSGFASVLTFVFAFVVLRLSFDLVLRLVLLLALFCIWLLLGSSF